MTDETPTPELPDADDESLRGGTTEVDNDEPLGVQADGDTDRHEDKQPGIPSGDEPSTSG